MRTTALLVVMNGVSSRCTHSDTCYVRGHSVCTGLPTSVTKSAFLCCIIYMAKECITHTKASVMARLQAGTPTMTPLRKVTCRLQALNDSVMISDGTSPRQRTAAGQRACTPSHTVVWAFSFCSRSSCEQV